MNDTPYAESEDEIKARVRQQERTVDNLNRLFAMLFSIVFSIAAASLLDRVVRHLRLPYKPVDLQILSFTLLSIIILGTTAAIFFHQASRGLDLRYGANAEIEPHSLAFIFDYLVIVLTMVPFAFMGKALDKNMTDASGFVWFFISHEVLILVGLVLLIIGQFRIQLFHPRSINPSFRKTAIGVERYWFFMNSFYLVLTSLGFFIASKSYTSNPQCPLYPHRSGALVFMVAFFVLAMMRNAADYFQVWKVFFPVKPDLAGGQHNYPLPLQRFINYNPYNKFGIKLSDPIILGYLAFFLALYILIFESKLYNIEKWAVICS
jgi:hypothetical protein